MKNLYRCILSAAVVALAMLAAMLPGYREYSRLMSNIEQAGAQTVQSYVTVEFTPDGDATALLSCLQALANEQGYSVDMVYDAAGLATTAHVKVDAAQPKPTLSASIRPAPSAAPCAPATQAGAVDEQPKDSRISGANKLEPIQLALSSTWCTATDPSSTAEPSAIDSRTAAPEAEPSIEPIATQIPEQRDHTSSLPASNASPRIRITQPLHGDAWRCALRELELRAAVGRGASVYRCVEGASQSQPGAQLRRMLNATGEWAIANAYMSATLCEALRAGTQYATRTSETGTRCLIAAPYIPFDY